MSVRDWIFVEDHCAGIDTVLRRGKRREVYNIGGCQGRTDLELMHRILELAG